jgi:hypothetical protein
MEAYIVILDLNHEPDEPCKSRRLAIRREGEMLLQLAKA